MKTKKNASTQCMKVILILIVSLCEYCFETARIHHALYGCQSGNLQKKVMRKGRMKLLKIWRKNYLIQES